MTRTLKKPALLIGYLIAFAAMIFADQYTKLLAVEHLQDKPSIKIIPGVFQLTYLENRGMAWGMLQGARYYFLILGSIVIVVLLYMFLRTPCTRRFALLRISLAGIMGGAVGNMIDRAVNGYVVDFFDFCLINFPIFNVADCFVVVAGILFVLVFLFVYKEEEIGEILPSFKKKSGDSHE